MPSSPAVAKGAELYGRICAVCHSATLEGYKADQAPSLVNPEFLGSVTDAFLRRAIADGRAGSTMSAWSSEHGGPLSASDIDALIAFIRSRGSVPRVTLDESPLRGDGKRGAQIYIARCFPCHGALGQLGPYVRIGNRSLLESASDGFLRHAIRFGRPKTQMNGFLVTLGNQGIEDVLAYLRGVTSEAPPANPLKPAIAFPTPIPLGPVPLNPHGPEPKGFKLFPDTTPVEVVHEELMQRHARMALLDARAPTDYAREHIAGAVSVPFYDPSPYLAHLPKDSWLVAYCSCPHAESGELAQKLKAAGFPKVTVLAEGLGLWSVKKYPIHSGDKP